MTTRAAVPLTGPRRAATVGRGLLAGVAGTAAETLVTRLERRLRHGRRPVYAPDTMADRLSTRFPGRPLSVTQGRSCGTVMHWSYGPAWGVAFAIGAERLQRQLSILRSGALLGTVIWSFELVALPATGATPPLRQWGMRQVLMDGAGAVAFGLCTSIVLALLDGLSSTTHSRPSAHPPGGQRWPQATTWRAATLTVAALMYVSSGPPRRPVRRGGAAGQRRR
jgi:hypothetical protein